MNASATHDLITRYYDAFNRGDWPGMLDLLDDHVAHDINQGAREVGKPAFAAFLERMNRCYAEQLRDVVIMVSEDGRRAAAEYVVRGEYKADDAGLPKANGQKYSLPGGAFFEVRDGRIARISNFYNLNDWLRQVEEARRP